MRGFNELNDNKTKKKKKLADRIDKRISCIGEVMLSLYIRNQTKSLNLNNESSTVKTYIKKIFTVFFFFKFLSYNLLLVFSCLPKFFSALFFSKFIPSHELYLLIIHGCRNTEIREDLFNELRTNNMR